MSKIASGMIDSLSSVMPGWLATLVVAAAIGVGAWCVVGIPLTMGWDYLRKHWWGRTGKVEHRLFLLLIGGGPIVYARGSVAEVASLRTIGIVSIVGAMALVGFGVHRQRGHATAQDADWETRRTTAGGLPVVTWMQQVDTGLIQKDARTNLELSFLVGILVAGAAIGWIYGDLPGAGVGFLIACFVAPAVGRDAVPPKLENVGGFVPMPGRWTERQPTELERKIDGEPIIEQWEAQAFIQAVNDDPIAHEPYFVVHWRNGVTRQVQIRSHRAWLAMASFELESAERVFGSRGTPLPYRDPWVIITRSDDGRVLELARDMTGQAQLQQVLMRLTQEFGVERRAVFKRERDAERRKRGLDKPNPPAAVPLQPATPKKKPVL